MYGLFRLLFVIFLMLLNLSHQNFLKNNNNIIIKVSVGLWVFFFFSLSLLNNVFINFAIWIPHAIQLPALCYFIKYFLQCYFIIVIIIIIIFYYAKSPKTLWKFSWETHLTVRSHRLIGRANRARKSGVICAETLRKNHRCRKGRPWWNPTRLSDRNRSMVSISSYKSSRNLPLLRT